MNKLELQKTSNEIRKDIVTAVHSAKSGHPGGSLSAADVFTYLYFEEMKIDPKNPKDPDRDRFVLSKGHNAPGLYSALAERGYFPKEDLVTLLCRIPIRSAGRLVKIFFPEKQNGFPGFGSAFFPEIRR